MSVFEHWTDRLWGVLISLGLASKNADVVFFGLDGAGKTTLLYMLKHDHFGQFSSTNYACTEQFTISNVNFSTYDFSGALSYRHLWSDYISQGNGIVFVVDSSDPGRFSEAKVELDAILSHEALVKSPFLVFGNKMDLPGAVTEDELRKHLGLQQTTGKDAIGNSSNGDGRPIEVFMCSITQRQGYAEGLASKHVRVLVLGPDGAGKTTLLNLMKHGRLAVHQPSLHPSSEDFTFEGLNFTLIDLGGTRHARYLWHEYASPKNPLILLVDSSDPERFSEVKDYVDSVLSYKAVSKSPILMFGTKADAPGAVTEEELRRQINLQETTGKGPHSIQPGGARPIELFMCSVVQRKGYEEGENPDPITTKPKRSQSYDKSLSSFAMEEGSPTRNVTVKGEDIDKPIENDNIYPQRLGFEMQNPLVEDTAPKFKAPPPTHRKKYTSSSEIKFSPERAVEEGLKMVKTISDNLKELSIGNKMRKDAWQKDTKDLSEQKPPTTLIAVCGATGVGKSSILNAILDDNIVPTSGMRACTSVVTEISYHTEKTISADVVFLSEEEWRQELNVLLREVTDHIEDVGNPPSKLSPPDPERDGHAGIAWKKIETIYPNLDYQTLVETGMDVQQIIDLDPNLTENILGTTKEISARDSNEFSKKIARYIDSEDPKAKDDVDDSGSTNDAIGLNEDSEDESMVDGPPLWPLICQVNIRCRAKALRTGAVLVDLPGVADANAARGSVAKEYMGKADCIWILAPIQRAVDDKIATHLLGDAFKLQLKNGNYHDHCITFIATKCDDVSSTEIIRALKLRDNPNLREIEKRMAPITKKLSEYRKHKAADEKIIKSGKAEIRKLEASSNDLKGRLEALRNGNVSGGSKRKEGGTIGTKRKTTESRKKPGPSTKKRRGGTPLDADFYDCDSDASDSDSDVSDSTSKPQVKQITTRSKAKLESVESSSQTSSADAGGETEEDLRTKLDASKQEIEALRRKLEAAEIRLKQACDDELALDKDRAVIQKEKDAFCSLRRSEYSETRLKDDFRKGLMELDDSQDIESASQHPSGNPPQDYSTIDLPVFTCSSRDYVKLTGQIEGDGKPSCFSHVNQTGIPQLRRWCHTLTVESRERTAHRFLSKTFTLSESIASYLGAGEVTEADRKALRDRWASRTMSSPGNKSSKEHTGFMSAGEDSDAEGSEDCGIPTEGDSDPNEDVDQLQDGESNTGIAARLSKDFSDMVDSCVLGLKNRFKNDLDSKCREGVASASESAVAVVEKYAPLVAARNKGMHWSTYRATLRRHGVWRFGRFGNVDLNVEFVTPLTKSISQSWIRLFESDLFDTFKGLIDCSINKLLEDFAKSAPDGLNDRASIQGQKCLEEARMFLHEIMGVAERAMANERKAISRDLAPHVQTQLGNVYDEAGSVKRRGASVRLKALFRQHIEEHKQDIFEGTADIIFSGLNKAASAVGKTLGRSLGSLAKKIELNLGVLWEAVKPDPVQVQARAHVAGVVAEVQGQLGLWLEALQLQKDARTRQNEDIEMGGDEKLSS